MKFRDEYRDRASAQRLANAISQCITRPWTLMEICGGQTHAIMRFGIDALLPPTLTLMHGPGCPVCVTPSEYIDKAIEIASQAGVILCSFGDMLRVPGNTGDLLTAKSRGADIRPVYSPLNALAIARAEPQRTVVFLAIGFETTAPANAFAVYQARRESIQNFSMLVSQVLVPPAMRALLEAPNNRIEGFLAAGHVCTVTGYEEYEIIAADYHIPIVITGFEPLDILMGIYLCVRQLEAGQALVENPYSRSVRHHGNPLARRILREVFCVIPQRWRGLGDLAESGLGLAEAYADFDAERRFGPVIMGDEADGECISGQVLRGECEPTACPAFGTRCTSEHPLGVTMVSTEGACAAYYRYRGSRQEQVS
jgi:hydrogenase expression/formation protein HypD